MNTSESIDQPKDIGTKRWQSYLIWHIPLAIIFIGIISLWINPVLVGWFWGIALLWGGAACITNAIHCKRKHCFFTGPLYLTLGIAALIKALNLISYNWIWLWAIFFVGTALAFLTEHNSEKYYRINNTSPKSHE